ncbi:peptidoglycan DD-metalloendopeptidase family protein [uncultured Polaribacter sp.]|uniref:peptidoglycan DD-metalloendopeptidase family protein n=1 Tax=uncultured Polaribacter sp. TaxID=174711 RepID=UPI00262B0D35|nr:peptidoglycan DD-metalloendopeptidase family protein [uncultured Polaribacter sp.]
MKKITLLIALISLSGISQVTDIAKGGEYKLNPSKIACINDNTKAKIAIQIQKSRLKLRKQGKLKSKKTAEKPSFIWPVRKNAQTPYNNSWAVSNFLDYDTNFPNKLKDYNCGTRTYDTQDGYNHNGLDIYTWPFSWYQFQNNMSEVIAAAAGTIIFKEDGKPDMNCGFSNLTWNAVYIEHSDGSVAWYGHLKTGTLTNKNVGDSVAEGEYLGVIGSSGSSTGPHLHFEVYDNNNNLVDPFTGPCNTAASWWKNQPDYYSPNINTVLTHNSAPEFNTCPQTETTNIKNEFLPNTKVILASYFKDQKAGTSSNYNLTGPGGFSRSWSKSFTSNFDSSYWFWTMKNLNTIGEYTFTVTYEGQTVAHKFNVVNVLNVTAENIKAFKILTNPVKNVLKINTPNNTNIKDYNTIIYNNLGQEMYKNNALTTNLDVQFLNKGLYIVKIYSKLNYSSKSIKIIKE